MRVLILGGRGQVGHDLVHLLRKDAEVHHPARHELDLTDPSDIRRAYYELRPDLVINAAAYTDVERAESEPDEALAVNSRAPAAMAEEAARLAVPFVHYSTDYVFDGEKRGAYREEDPTAPVNVYGRSKVLGDRAVIGSGAAHLILRVGWVYSTRRRNFLTKMLELFSARETVRVVADECGAPTWSREIARGTVAALESLGGPRRGWSRDGLLLGFRRSGGLYHLAPEGETSRHGFAEEILRLVRERNLFPTRVLDLVPIGSEEWPSAAKRPRNGLLDGGRARSRLGVRLPAWRASLASCLDEVAVARPV